MSENERREAVLKQAIGWLGRGEADGSHAEILRVYNAIRPLPRGHVMALDEPWCAAFVSAVGAVCGLTAVLYPECGCAPMLARYRAEGRFTPRGAGLPEPGDLVFYDWDGDGAPDHVGILEEREGERLTVIEGNFRDCVGLRHLDAGASGILGFARPDYAADTAEAAVPDGAAESPAPEPEIRTAALPLPCLARGSRGETVRAAQLLLIGRGYRCGPCGADGDFGPATYGGVCSFQRGRRLEIDGVIGPHTWRALLGLGEGAGT